MDTQVSFRTSVPRDCVPHYPESNEEKYGYEIFGHSCVGYLEGFKCCTGQAISGLPACFQRLRTRARTHTQKPQLFIKLPVIYHQLITRYRNFGHKEQTRAVGAPLSVQENLLLSLVPYSKYNV